MRAYNFLYSRVGDFYNACVLWIIILTASLYYRNSKNTKLFIVLALINMCATLRSRAWGYALLFVILYYALIIRKERKFRWWYAAAFATMVSFISADQFSYYFSGNRARKVLLKYGFITARNYFPLGSGFATYGTAIAQRHYSELYRPSDIIRSCTEYTTSRCTGGCRLIADPSSRIISGRRSWQKWGSSALF